MPDQPPKELIEALENAGPTVIWQQEDQQCDLCGEIRELRPYGPDGETICFPCATSTPERKAAAERAMEEYLG